MLAWEPGRVMPVLNKCNSLNLSNSISSNNIINNININIINNSSLIFPNLSRQLLTLLWALRYQPVGFNLLIHHLDDHIM